MIDVLREYPPAITWLKSLDGEEIVLPGFVVMELIQGCRNKSEQEKLEAVLCGYGVLWPSIETCNDALSAFLQCRLSHGIGIIDTLIGQMAIGMGLSLHTFNQKHYAPLAGLRTIQPYRKSP
jgi:predicted nucleic acid-binding protein